MCALDLGDPFEPTYIDVDDDGAPTQKGRPKWQIPETTFQRKIVSACKCKYFKKHEKGQINLIDHSMSSWIPGMTVPKYPAQWIDELIEWANKKNNAIGGYSVITVQSLLAAIGNEDNKKAWIAKQLESAKKSGTMERNYGDSPYGSST